MNKLFNITFAAILCLAAAHNGFARGFGGFHGGGGFGGGGFHGGDFGGGGFHGGDFGGGGFHGGDFHGGDFGGGGYHGGGFEDGGFHGGDLGGGGYHAGGYGGYHAGGLDGGGFHGGGYGATASRGQLNSFLGMPTDGGMHAASRSGYAAGPEGLAAGRAGAVGSVHEGPGGTTVAHGTAGAQGFAAGPGGAAAGGGVVHGTAIKGPEGNVYYHGGAAGRGAAYGRGAVTASGTHYYSATYAHTQALGVQGWYGGHAMFTPAWSAAHAWAWHPLGYTAAAWSSACWSAPAWPSIASWFGWSGAPQDYTYGDNIVYQDNNVYYGPQQVATATQYYTEASDLANSGSGAQTGEDTQWLPLGVFGLVAGEEKTPEATFQLAVNKDGIIQGNCIKPPMENTQAVYGAVDKKSQRAAWQIGHDNQYIVDTGLYNLTRDEAPALLHRGPDKTEQVLLVRVKQPSADQGAQ